MRPPFALALATAVALALTGCATSPAPTPTPSATTPASMTPTEAKAAYKLIAKASCDKAQAEGVVETGNGFTIVSVPKSKGYKDYSAAYLEDPDTYGLIWELDSIVSCADWYSFSMSEEAGTEAAIDVTFNPEDSTFTTVEDFGEAGTYTYRYVIAEGRIATAINLIEPEKVTNVIYGALTEDHLNILKTAVDQFLAKG